MARANKSKNILGRVRKYFPKVLTVSDETKDRVVIHVTEYDCRKATPGDFNECAMARALRREHKADGSIIGLTHSYIIKGTHATRYTTPASVQRELVSFDRNQDFDQGTYHLAPVTPNRRIGSGKDKDTGVKSKGTKSIKVRIHTTTRVRTQP